MDRNEASAETLTDSSLDESSDEDIVDESLRNGDQEDNEKLSEVIEEPEEYIEVKKDTFNRDDSISFENNNNKEMREDCENVKILRDRISQLNDVVLSLRIELSRELSLWKKEREEYRILQEKTDLFALDEATAAARAAAEAYAAESPLSNNLNAVQYNCCGEILDVNPEQTLSELTILEYEKKLAKYQDALAFSQAEKRYNMRRQLAANTYRKKLIEVERLCDEELEKIKESANCLKPLKKMISQWIYRDDRCAGDADKPLDDLEKSFDNNTNLQNGYSRYSEFCHGQDTRNIQIEVNMAPEIFSEKFNNADQIRDVSIRDNLMQSGSTDWLMANNYDEKNISESANPLPTLKWESSNYALSTSL